MNNVDASLLADGYYTLASTVNNAPLIDNITNPAAINEDAAQQTITLTGISDIETATNALTLATTSDNTAVMNRTIFSEDVKEMTQFTAVKIMILLRVGKVMISFMET